MDIGAPEACQSKLCEGLSWNPSARMALCDIRLLGRGHARPLWTPGGRGLPVAAHPSPLMGGDHTEPLEGTPCQLNRCHRDPQSRSHSGGVFRSAPCSLQRSRSSLHLFGHVRTPTLAQPAPAPPARPARVAWRG